MASYWRRTVQLIRADSGSKCSQFLTTPPSPVRHFSLNFLVCPDPDGGFSSSSPSFLFEGWLAPVKNRHISPLARNYRYVECGIDGKDVSLGYASVRRMQTGAGEHHRDPRD
ncbi:hypothetical protein QQF64_014204 [Cirrhinus molitorella]|uniref:Uncharacterized protein n=1 Tax=Cirrhinus molitorella TaxID=172907 RepID=A0ABR3LXJ5_9TELE